MDDDEGEEVEEVEKEPTEDIGEACFTSRDAMLITKEHENDDWLRGLV